MHSKKRINSIRKMKCDLFKGKIERPRYIYGGSSASNFMEVRRTHEEEKQDAFLLDDFEPEEAAFYIGWDEEKEQLIILDNEG